jgi:hypothetical protein
LIAIPRWPAARTSGARSATVREAVVALDVPLKMKELKMMDQIGMTPAQRAKVMGGNAARLLKLN